LAYPDYYRQALAFGYISHPWRLALTLITTGYFDRYSEPKRAYYVPFIWAFHL